jgi:hypothetical protein
MLRYPVVYAILHIPLTVVRYITFYQEKSGVRTNDILSAVTITAVALFELNGVMNVLLLFLTRGDRDLLEHQLPARNKYRPPPRNIDTCRCGFKDGKASCSQYGVICYIHPDSALSQSLGGDSDSPGNS